MARAAEMLSDVLGAPVSTGFLAALVPEAAGALVFVAHVVALLSRSPVLHADETLYPGVGAKLVAARHVDHRAHLAGVSPQTRS